MNRRTLLSSLGLSAAALLLAVTPPGAMAQDGEAAQSAKPQAKAKIGEAAPQFTLKDTKGKTHDLSDYAGKIVVLEWYNPGCPFVVACYGNGTPRTTLEQVREVDPDVVYLTINSTGNMPVAAVVEQSDKFMAKQKLELPVLMDHDGAVGHLYQARTTPHMFVIDKDGMLRFQGAYTESVRDKDATNYVVNAVRLIAAGETVAPDYVKPWGCSVKYAK